MNVSDFQPLVPFLAAFFGKRAEVVLYDPSRVVAVLNPFEEDRRPGDPLGDVERRLIRDKVHETGDYCVNYRSLTRRREKLRGATLFLKDRDGALAGLLTINLKVDRLLEARSIINELINGISEADFQDPAPIELFESLNVTLEGHVATLVQQALAEFGVSVDRLSPREKRSIVKTLDGKGVFLIKGSVAEVARQTASSAPTIYRYLDELTGPRRRGGKQIARKITKKKKENGGS